MRPTASTTVGLTCALLGACADQGAAPCWRRMDEPEVLVELAGAVCGREAYATARSGYATPAPPRDVPELEARARTLRTLLLDHAGVGETRQPPGATIVASLEMDGVRIEHLRLDGWGGMTIPATFYVPTSASADAPVPAVVLHVGHDADGERSPYLRSIAWSLAHGGVAALTLDWLGTGTRFLPENRHVPTGLRARLVGLAPELPLLGEPLSAWDYVTARPEVDPARVAMAGQSGGGWATMMLAVAEPRVAAAVVMDIAATNSFMLEELVGWGDPESIPPGTLARTSHGELLGMIAPRPLLVISGDDDDGIAPTVVSAVAVRSARPSYALLGVPGAILHEGFAGEHEVTEAKIVRTIEFFGQTLTARQLPRLVPPPWLRPDETLDEPLWTDLVDARYRRAPEAPRDRAEALLAQDATRAALTAVVGDVVALQPPAPVPGYTDRTIVLWLADFPVGKDARDLVQLGLPVVALTPAGLDSIRDSDADRLHLAQNAIGMDRTLLGLGLEDLLGTIAALRAAGATRILAACDGEQAALLCLAAAARGDGPDAVAARGLPSSWPIRFTLGALPPDTYYVTPRLGELVTIEELVAAAAPRPVVLLPPPRQRPFLPGKQTRPLEPAWELAPATYARLDAADALVLDATGIVPATAHAAQLLGAEP